MRVFLSYSTIDKKFVKRLHDALTSREIDVWTDESIAPGQSWTEAIKSAVESSDAIVAVLSPASAKSAAVSSELALALSDRWSGKGKPIIPVLAAPTKDVPIFLRHLQWADLSDDERFENNLDSVVESIEGKFRKEDDPRDERARIELLMAQKKLLDRETEVMYEIRKRSTQTLISSVAITTTMVMLTIMAFGLSGRDILFFNMSNMSSDTPIVILVSFFAGVGSTYFASKHFRRRFESSKPSESELVRRVTDAK